MTSELDRKPKRGLKKSSAGKAERYSAERPFVNINLTPEQEAEKATFIPDHATLFSLLMETLENGYTASVKYDDYNSAFACFLRSSPEDEFNADLVLAGRGGSPASAIRETLYAHYRVFAGNWRSSNERGVRDLTNDDF